MGDKFLSGDELLGGATTRPCSTTSEARVLFHNVNASQNPFKQKLEPIRARV